MINLRRSFALITVALVTSSAASGETQKGCQSAELIPKNVPTSWVTANDFPTHLYFRIQKPMDSTGIYRLSVGVDGRAVRCTVLKATISDILDMSMCANLKRRARFNKLDDINCADVVRVYDFKARFIISGDNADPQVTTSKV